jgi:4-hydroxybenzoate polyprenyltransferase
MAAFGIFLPGGGYLFLARTPDPSCLWLMVPLFLAGLFFIVSVELPDYENDRRTAKKTLVVRLGPRTALVAGTAAVAGSLLLVLVAGAWGLPPGRFFPAMGAGLMILILAGAYGISRESTDFSTAEKITGLNITAIILFFLIGIAALATAL